MLVSSLSFVVGLSTSKSAGREGITNPPKVADEEKNRTEAVIFSEGGPISTKSMKNVVPKTTKTSPVEPEKKQPKLPKILPAEEVQVRNSSIVARKGVPDDLPQSALPLTPVNSTLTSSSEATPSEEPESAPGPKKFSFNETLDESKSSTNASTKTTIHSESTTESKKTTDVTSQTINKTESSTVSTKPTPVVVNFIHFLT